MYNSLTFTVDGVQKTLNRVNQDNYSSEFVLRETDGEYRARIRHTQYADKKRGGKKVERHNVELTHTLFSIDDSTFDTVRKSYMVVENDFRDDHVAVGDEVVALADFFTPTRISELLVWTN